MAHALLATFSEEKYQMRLIFPADPDTLDHP
jgi:hypothetical protein